jgi:hypothetical protein
MQLMPVVQSIIEQCITGYLILYPPTQVISNRRVTKIVRPVKREDPIVNHNAITLQESVMPLQSQTPRVVKICQMDLQHLRGTSSWIYDWPR